jgi:hypothetical protein
MMLVKVSQQQETFQLMALHMEDQIRQIRKEQLK